MSHPKEQTEDELAPTQTENYRVGQTKTVAELAELDKEDESLQRWKQSLGIGSTAGSSVPKAVILKSLFLSSPTKSSPISLDLSKGPMTIKEGVEYSVGITFTVQGEIVSGLKFIQVVKRAGVTVDRSEEMIGSYGPQEAPYTKVFPSEESPSGMLARAGTNNVRSRIVDDDGHVWLDFEWAFKLAKDW
ncbi:hypothetical protein IAU60_006612 [Kwoniella sp. DSM 27419]